MEFYVYNFGCKVNQYESQVMTELLISSGYTYAADKENADIFIINSCTVTSSADSKVMKLMRRLRREKPHCVIVLTGCMTQSAPDLSAFSQADIILGNTDRRSLPDKLSEYLLRHTGGGEGTALTDVRGYSSDSVFEPISVSSYMERTRAIVKIEDGCDRYCSYCVIPFARGPVRSKLPDSIREEAECLSAAGYREIVLVGINLTAYGRELGLTLCDAVECVCSVSGIDRVRLGSMEPEMLDRDAIDRLARLSKLCPQFHLSLQSGCDSTLKRMNRHYTSREYMDIVDMLRSSFDNCAVTTDVMVGFAGETEDEFEQSLAFVKKAGFAKAHVFPYSRREGTVAARAKNQVDNNTKAARSKIMLSAAAELRADFLRSQVGRREPVLFEQTDKDGLWEGYTPNYTPVKVSSQDDLNDRIFLTELTGVGKDCCMGILLGEVND